MGAGAQVGCALSATGMRSSCNPVVVQADLLLMGVSGVSDDGEREGVAAGWSGTCLGEIRGE